jgi:RNA 2',3'-cyclic 3'-phosphodiesterase
VKKKKIRLFTGIPIPPHFSELFQNFINQNKRIENINWVKPHNLHITLSFIGDTSTDQLEEIIKQTVLLADHFPPFEFNFKEINFNSSENPYMLWATFLNNETFQEMVLLSSELLALGPIKYPKIIPHVTLARFKNIAQPEAVDFDLNIENPVLEVKKLILWESQVSRQGSEYTPIKEFHLEH